MQKRFEALTGIRSIAAIMVFLYHNRKYWRDGLPEFVTRNLNEYHTGVTLFFVLSGFLIAYTYDDTPLSSGREYTKYLLTRLVRIFPVYIIILSLKYIDWGFPATGEIIRNYTLAKGFSDVHNLDGIPQSWSLTVELSFYTLAPLIYFFTKKNIAKTFLSLLLLCMLVIGIGYWWKHMNNNPYRWFYNWWFIMDGTFFGRFFEFFMGMLLAHSIKTEKPFLQKLNGKRLTLISSITLLLLIYIISFFEKDIYSHGTEKVPGLIIRNLLMPVVICFLLHGLMFEQTGLRKFLSTKVMVLLGNASFLFYLVHIGWVNKKIGSMFMLPDRNFVVLWIVAIVGYLLIEKPIYLFCRKLIKKL